MAGPDGKLAVRIGVSHVRSVVPQFRCTGLTAPGQTVAIPHMPATRTRTVLHVLRWVIGEALIQGAVLIVLAWLIPGFVIGGPASVVLAAVGFVLVQAAAWPFIYQLSARLHPLVFPIISLALNAFLLVLFTDLITDLGIGQVHVSGPWVAALIVVALGITWILDGLEVTLAGAVAGALKESPSLGLSNAEVGLASSLYLAGAVTGALFFGWLTDRLGRKRLFFITLTVYLVATAATAFAWDFPSFALFRFLTGAGIGGEYTAIASAIQEFVPARYRGHTDLVINGSFWLGAALGAGASIVLLDPALLPPDMGWRAAFFIGSVFGLFIW